MPEGPGCAREGDQAIEAIRRTVTAERFFEILAKLAPKVSAFHRPALQLDLSVGGAHHKVNLYDPAELGKDTGGGASSPGVEGGVRCPSSQAGMVGGEEPAKRLLSAWA